MKKYVLKFGALAGVVMLVASLVAEAATMPYASEEPSTAAPTALASHEMKFVTTSGVHSPGQTIRINFGVNGYTLNDNTQKSYRMTVGSSDNCEATSGWTNKLLANSPAAGKWGVVDNKVDDYVTFTAPTDATTGEIPANRCVWISVGGPNSTNGALFVNNPNPEGVKPLTIDGTFGDTGSFNALIVTATPNFSVSNVHLIVNADHTLKIDDAAITYSLPPTAGELQFTFLPSSCSSGGFAAIKSALNTFPYCGDPIGFALLRPNDYYWNNNATGWLVIGACHDANIDCGDNPSNWDVGFISAVEIKSGLKPGTITLKNSI